MDLRRELDSLSTNKETVQDESHKDKSNRKFNALFKYLMIMDAYNCSNKIDVNKAIGISLPNYPK